MHMGGGERPVSSLGDCGALSISHTHTRPHSCAPPLLPSPQQACIFGLGLAPVVGVLQVNIGDSEGLSPAPLPQPNPAAIMDSACSSIPTPRAPSRCSLSQNALPRPLRGKFLHPHSLSLSATSLCFQVTGMFFHEIPK